MSEGGYLKVQSRVNGGRVEISFSDNGHGMEEDVISKAFSPFFTTQGNSTAKAWA